MEQYTETRKADRAFMAQAVIDLAHSFGATAERSEFKPDGDHRIEIELNGLCAGIDFERRSCQPNVFLIPWNTRGQIKLRPEFALVSVNPFHFGKATLVAYGFASLMAILANGLHLAQTGEAFQ